MSQLISLKNIGKALSHKLESVGIDEPEKLVAIGAQGAFLKLRERYQNVCLVHLYALQGAVCGAEMSMLSEQVKNEL